MNKERFKKFEEAIEELGWNVILYGEERGVFHRYAHTRNDALDHEAAR